eukprot:885604-Prymnesium_polylepis.1
MHLEGAQRARCHYNNSQFSLDYCALWRHLDERGMAQSPFGCRERNVKPVGDFQPSNVSARQ